MLTPSWTATRTHPVALADVVSLIVWSLATPEPLHGSFDIGGPEVMTYRSMMERTAEVLGVERQIVPVPVLTPRLSALWVRLVTGASSELVVPLVQSLVHPMVARDRALQARADVPGIPFAQAMADAIAAEQGTVSRSDSSRSRDRAAAVAAKRSLRPRKPRRDIRAVHRLDVRSGTTATAVAERYLDWLPGGLGLLRIVEAPGGCFEVGLPGVPLPLLVLRRRADRDTPSRAFLEVAGGLLAAGAPRGDLEFRLVNDHLGAATVVLAIVEGFVPRLPWWLYRRTQAPAHSLVMWGFRRALAALGAAPSDRRVRPTAESGGRLHASQVS